MNSLFCSLISICAFVIAMTVTLYYKRPDSAIKFKTKIFHKICISWFQYGNQFLVKAIYKTLQNFKRYCVLENGFCV